MSQTLFKVCFSGCLAQGNSHISSHVFLHLPQLLDSMQKWKLTNEQQPSTGGSHIKSKYEWQVNLLSGGHFKFVYAVIWCEVWKREMFHNCSEQFLVHDHVPENIQILFAISGPLIFSTPDLYQSTAYLKFQMAVMN